MLVMGVNRLPEIRDYWSRDEKLHNSFIASRISRDRFEEISRYLHFTDNTTLPARDEPSYHRLQKVLPMITELKRRFVEAYSPHAQNSIDEAMIPFKGIVTYRYKHTVRVQYSIYCAKDYACTLSTHAKLQ